MNTGLFSSISQITKDIWNETAEEIRDNRGSGSEGDSEDENSLDLDIKERLAKLEREKSTISVEKEALSKQIQQMSSSLRNLAAERMKYTGLERQLTAAQNELASLRQLKLNQEMQRSTSNIEDGRNGNSSGNHIENALQGSSGSSLDQTALPEQLLLRIRKYESLLDDSRNADEDTVDGERNKADLVDGIQRNLLDISDRIREASDWGLYVSEFVSDIFDYVVANGVELEFSRDGALHPTNLKVLGASLKSVLIGGQKSTGELDIMREKFLEAERRNKESFMEVSRLRNQLTNTIRSTAQQNEEASREQANLQNECQRITRELSNVTEELSDSNTENQELRTQNHEYALEVSTLRLQLKDKEVKYKDAMESVHRKMQSAVLDGEHKIHKSSRNLTELMNQNQELKSELQATKARLEETTESLSDIQAVVDIMHSESNDAMDAKLAELELERESLKGKLSALTSQLETARSYSNDADTARKKLAEVERERNEALAVCEKQKAQIAEISNGLKSYSNKLRTSKVDQESLIDKKLVNGMITSYFKMATQSSQQQKDVLILMSKILDFNDDELEAVGLKARNARNEKKSLDSGSASLGDLWIQFLLDESKKDTPDGGIDK